MLDGNGEPLKATGDCFENCSKWMIGDPTTDLVVVHCLVTGTGRINGIDYSHAFLLDEIAGLVFDVAKSLDEPIIVPVKFYRECGNVRDEIHYTRDEVLAHIKETEHWGPWDESLSTDADRFCETSA